ncbi:hypothetical protein GCM10023321_55630 [Pseudonocardia eucalypti]|uniref:Uncharacterized protein n=1 Tax=Pseudonocardia eucalypti TaxID=648755 RepID=A0ABP9QPV0_9PSEU|nr:hypothetical protein [Pseudonocardia eucalypti]
MKLGKMLSVGEVVEEAPAPEPSAPPADQPVVTVRADLDELVDAPAVAHAER